MITFTAQNIDLNVLEFFQKFSIENNISFSVKRTTENENLEIINNEPKTLAGVFLSVPKLDLEDDFFDIPQEPMRELDWGE